MGTVRRGVVLYGRKKEEKLLGTRYGVDELHAGKYGAVLAGNGGPGADIYYGGASRDEFIHGMIGTADHKIKTATTHEIIYGYTSGQDDIYYGGTFKNGKVSGRDVILNFSTGTVRVKNGAGKSITLISSKDDSEKNYTFGKPVLAKGLSYQDNKRKLLVQAPFKGTIKKWSYDSSAKEIDARSVKNKINIEGNQGNLTIRAGQAGGTIWAGSGNDTIYGGKGVDVFRYQRKDEGDPDGRDKIYNYESGRDIIRVEKGYYRMYTDGNDVIMNFGEKHKEINNKRVTVGPDTVRIVDGAGKKIIIEDGNGKRVTKTVYRKIPAYASYNSRTAAVTFKRNTPATAFDAKYYGAGIRTLNGKDAGKHLNLIGNALNNTIYAGKAGGVLSGLSGNDTLYGGNGVDTFRYTSGADTIIGYQGGRDIIQLASGRITGHKVRGNDVLLNIGKGSITIKGGANKKLLVKDSKGQTHNYIYKVAAKKNNVSYMTKVQGIGSAKSDSVMHLSGKKNNTMANITLAGHSQSASVNFKKSI